MQLKRVWKKAGATIALCSCLTFGAFSQQTGGASWSLSECIDYALQNNIQVKTEKLDIIASRSDLEQAKAERLPSVSASVGQSLTNGRNTNPVIGGFMTQSSLAGNYSLNVSWTLFNAGVVRNNIEQSELLVKSAALDVKGAENNTILSVTEGYLNVLYAREYIGYAEQILETTESQLQATRTRVEAGAATKKELAQIQSQYASDRYTVTSANNLYQQQLLNLKQLLQIPADQPLELERPDIQEEVVSEDLPSLDQLYSNAARIIPQVENAEIGIDVAELELKKAKAGYLPYLSLSLGASTGYSDNQELEYISQVEQNFYQRGGLSLNIPIFSQKANKNRVERARVAIERAELTRQDAELSLKQTVEQAYLNVSNSLSQLESAREQIAAAEESYRIANDHFEVGLIGSVELLQEKSRYISALDSYVQTKYNALINTKLLDFYMGMPVTL